jgi:diaminohydroxyphosphoribosylaminopyrimidine deaminase/5-amino-6-(5-phosphoribosylamino)uracil reductase
MPWIEAKVAISHDGFVATADGKRTDLTGEVSRCFVHRRRNMHDAVAVGGQTVRTDLPRLDARFGDPSRTPPAAVIFSISGEMTWDAPLFHVPGRDVFLVTGYESAEKLSVPRGVHLVIAKTVTESYGPRLDMEDALRHLAAADLRSLYVEPGPALLRSLQPYINELFVIEGDRSLHSGKPWAPDTLQALYRKRPYMEQGCDVVWKMEKIDVYGNY